MTFTIEHDHYARAKAATDKQRETAKANFMATVMARNPMVTITRYRNNRDVTVVCAKHGVVLDRGYAANLLKRKCICTKCGR